MQLAHRTGYCEVAILSFDSSSPALPIPSSSSPSLPSLPQQHTSPVMSANTSRFELGPLDLWDGGLQGLFDPLSVNITDSKPTESVSSFDARASSPNPERLTRLPRSPSPSMVRTLTNRSRSSLNGPQRARGIRRGLKRQRFHSQRPLLRPRLRLVLAVEGHLGASSKPVLTQTTKKTQKRGRGGRRTRSHSAGPVDGPETDWPTHCKEH